MAEAELLLTLENVSALLIVQKPDGQGVRISMDPKFMNAALQRSTHYMQTMTFYQI